MGDKKSFVLYFDIREPLMLLSDEERGKLFLSLLDYAEYGEIPAFNGMVQMAFAFIKTAIDRDTTAWEAKSEKRAEAGSKGGKQTAANRANAVFARQAEQQKAIQAVPVSVRVPAPVSVRAPEPESKKADKPPRAARFVPPTVEEVAEYCRERGNHVDAQAFVDHYQANGWMRGKNKVQDWKACVRTWEREDKKTSGPPLKTPYDDLPPKSTTGDDLERLAKMLGVET